MLTPLRHLGRIPPRWILFAAWLCVIAYAFPGYMNWDDGDQLNQVRENHFTDWYPPLMVFYWRKIELVLSGPLGLLLLQTPLFLWGLHEILRMRLAPRAAAWTAAALMLFPPILTPMAPVWKDAQMAAFLIAGFACVMRPGRRMRVLGLFLLFLGVGVRDNAPAALPPLLLLVAGAWGFHRRLSAIGIAFGVFVALTASAAVANQALTDEHVHPWYRANGPWDIAGTICHADPIPEAELAELLRDTGHKETHDTYASICAGYSPRVWFATPDGVTPYFLFTPDLQQRAARKHAFWRLVREHPIAYLEHRVDVMAELLGLTSEPTWEAVCQTFAANDFQGRRVNHAASPSGIQKRLGRWFGRLGESIVYKPWAYLVLSLVFLGWAAVKRDTLVLALAGSGLLYEASYFVGAPAPDFRYSHWMVVMCCVSAVLIAVDRLRARASRPRARGDDPVV